MREAPAITDHRGLLARGREGAGVRSGGDDTWPRRIFGIEDHAAPRTSYDALKGADALAVVTEWNEFREPDFARMRKLMRAPVIFDGRNIYNPEQMQAQGFTYYLDRPLMAGLRGVLARPACCRS